MRFNKISVSKIIVILVNRVFTVININRSPFKGFWITIY